MWKFIQLYLHLNKLEKEETKLLMNKISVNSYAIFGSKKQINKK